MGGWRSRLVFLLIVYFVGFATAIYFISPVTEKQGGGYCQMSFPHSALKSDEFARSFNAGMHKCLDFSKEAACVAGSFIRQKMQPRGQIEIDG